MINDKCHQGMISILGPNDCYLMTIWDRNAPTAWQQTSLQAVQGNRIQCCKVILSFICHYLALFSTSSKIVTYHIVRYVHLYPNLYSAHQYTKLNGNNIMGEILRLLSCASPCWWLEQLNEDSRRSSFRPWPSLSSLGLYEFDVWAQPSSTWAQVLKMWSSCWQELGLTPPARGQTTLLRGTYHGSQSRVGTQSVSSVFEGMSWASLWKIHPRAQGRRDPSADCCVSCWQ